MERAKIEFGKMVKKRLIDLDMTQTELSKRLGISPQNLWRILNGYRSGKKHRKAIMELLGIKTDGTAA